MSSVGGTGSTSSSGSSSSSSNTGGGIQDLSMDQFLKLMLAELQNQDPMEPMKNSEMLQQIGQIRSITATEQLSTTLNNVLDGQNLLSGTTLIGGQVQALTDAGDVVFGVVTGCQITPNDDGVREVYLKVMTDSGIATCKLNDVFTVLPASGSSDGGTDTTGTDGTDTTGAGTTDTTTDTSTDTTDTSGTDSAAAA